MANEIVVMAASGQSCYVLLRNASGQVYNQGSSAFETYSAGNYANYALALAEQGSTGYYLGSVPGAVSAQGRYTLQAKAQSGAPAPADSTVAAGSLRWSGSSEVDVLASADKTGYTASTVQDKTGYSATVSGYGAGQDPASLVLLSAANKLRTNASGQVQADLAQSVPTSNTAQTVGDALNAARAQGFGAWLLSGRQLTLYAPDGTTVVRQFVLDNPTMPTMRS